MSEVQQSFDEIKSSISNITESSDEGHFEHNDQNTQLVDRDVKIAELKNALQIASNLSKEAQHVALAERQRYQKHIQQLEKRLIDYEEESRY